MPGFLDFCHSSGVGIETRQARNQDRCLLIIDLDWWWCLFNSCTMYYAPVPHYVLCTCALLCAVPHYVLCISIHPYHFNVYLSNNINQDNPTANKQLNSCAKLAMSIIRYLILNHSQFLSYKCDFDLFLRYTPEWSRSIDTPAFCDGVQPLLLLLLSAFIPS